MQVSIKNLSETTLHPDYRWDGEYLCFEPHQNSEYVYVPFGEILLSTQYGLSNKMNEDGNGTKIYRMNEISNMVCSRKILKYAPISEEEILTYNLNDKDVLFNRTNSQAFVGRTGIFRRFSDEPLVFASYLVRAVPDPEKVTPEYLTAFLNSKFGRLDIKRRSRISINQSNVNAEELKRVEIPLISSKLQLQVTTAFEIAYQLLQKSETIYSESQSILLSEVGLANWQEKHHLTFVKNYSYTEAFERIEAEFFQPKYEEIEEAINVYPGKCSQIGEEFKQNTSILKIDDKKIYQYVEIGSVNVLNGEITPIKVLGSELPANAKRILNKGDVIVSKVRTYRGAVTIVDENGYVGSGAFTVLQENGRINKETLQAFLHSRPLLFWSLKPNTGTSYPVINDDDILNIPIPLFPERIQFDVQEKVANSFRITQKGQIYIGMRNKSDRNCN